MERFKKYGIVLKPKKCQFGMTKIEYIGRVINKQGTIGVRSVKNFSINVCDSIYYKIFLSYTNGFELIITFKFWNSMTYWSFASDWYSFISTIIITNCSIIEEWLCIEPIINIIMNCSIMALVSLNWINHHHYELKYYLLVTLYWIRIPGRNPRLYFVILHSINTDTQLHINRHQIWSQGFIFHVYICALLSHKLTITNDWIYHR